MPDFHRAKVSVKPYPERPADMVENEVRVGAREVRKIGKLGDGKARPRKSG